MCKGIDYDHQQVAQSEQKGNICCSFTLGKPMQGISLPADASTALPSSVVERKLNGRSSRRESEEYPPTPPPANRLFKSPSMR